MGGVELGVHLPQMQFGQERLSLRRLEGAVDTARDCRFAAVSANDHFVFPDTLARRADGAREHD